MTDIQPARLIVGLGNPGKEYKNTRHNAGAWFVEALAQKLSVPLQKEKKVHGNLGKFSHNDQNVFLLMPSLFMNESGISVAACQKFFKLPLNSIIIVHDELDLPVGEIRLKEGGGHGGHNGLRDIFQRLGSKDFVRLRIGIGHPGHKDKVTPYVLKPASKKDKEAIDHAIIQVFSHMQDILDGDLQKAMREIH